MRLGTLTLENESFQCISVKMREPKSDTFFFGSPFDHLKKETPQKTQTQLACCHARKALATRLAEWIRRLLAAPVRNGPATGLLERPCRKGAQLVPEKENNKGPIHAYANCSPLRPHLP